MRLRPTVCAFVGLTGAFGPPVLMGPRPDYEHFTSEPPEIFTTPKEPYPTEEPTVVCDATKYFKPWKAQRPQTRGPRPTYEEQNREICIQPDDDCFQRTLLSRSEFDDKAWNEIRNNQFDSCNGQCVGFTGSQVEETINLCSLYVADYLYKFDREQNYIGFIFAAVKSGGKWYYNDDAFHTKTYRKGRKYKHAKIKTGYVIMKRADILAKKYGAPSRMRFHQALLEDFFGLTQKQMVQRGLFFVGWGFSYQAKDPKNSHTVCDFKFNSATINGGALFGKEPEFHVNHKGRQLHHMLGNFFRLGFNNMRAFETRTVKVETLLRFQYFYADQTKDYLPRCEANENPILDAPLPEPRYTNDKNLQRNRYQLLDFVNG